MAKEQKTFLETVAGIINKFIIVVVCGIVIMFITANLDWDISVKFKNKKSKDTIESIVGFGKKTFKVVNSVKDMVK